MRGSALVLLGGFGAVALFACSPQRGHAPALSEHDGVGVVKNGSSIVLTSALLHLENRSLLDVLHRRLPSLQIDATADCPEVFMRGRSSIMSASNAAIYVDGQRAANTCILETLYAFDLERVEVYPMGVTSRPGYFSDADGLILVFLRRGDH
jgi:hypothetical protein